MDTESTFGLYEVLAILGASAWLPQLVVFISKKFSKPKLTIIPDKDVEIGFTSLGPIFNIQIAFLAEKKKQIDRTYNFHASKIQYLGTQILIIE